MIELSDEIIEGLRIMQRAAIRNGSAHLDTLTEDKLELYDDANQWLDDLPEEDE